MSTLAFLLLTAGAARAEAPSRTLCDGFEVAAQRACIEQNYPVIHAKVEETCRAKPQGERRTCRTHAYAERGIHYGSTRAPSVGGIAPQTDANTGTPGTDTSSSAAVTPGAAGPTTETAPAGATDGTQGTTADGGFGSKNAQDSGASNDGGFGSKNAQDGGASGDGGFGSKNAQSDASRSTGGSQRMKALDPTTVTIATVALQTAGYTLQNVPTICQTIGCKMSKKQQKKLARWGGVIVTDVARIPKILGRKEADTAKVTRLLKVTQAIADKAPIGLSGQAKGYVDMALSALQTLVAAVGR